MKAGFTLLLIFGCIQNFVYAQGFTPGNLVIYRVGNGNAALTNAATAIFLDEYTPAGTFVQSLALPTTASGSNKIITASGTATSEGFLTRSTDKRYLMVTGYDAPVGTATVASSSGSNINRIIGRIDALSNLNATTALSDFASGNNPRSAFSTNGTDIWASGGAGGVRYTTLGSATSTQLSTTTTNIRVVSIFDGQLYISSASGSIRVASVGSGTPTTAGQVITNLPGTPDTGNPYGFFLADLSAAVPGVDVLYVADDVAGITKYSLIGGGWTSNGTVPGAARGLTGSLSGNTINLFATFSGALSTITDAGGYNVAFTGVQTSIATAVANTTFRGVALAPETGVLPTKLEYIKGQKATDGIILNWKVTCLSTNIVMEIERAPDTRNFGRVTYLEATQARCAEPFDFTDARPLEGKNYYRLKIINIDGEISYSPVVVVINASKGIEIIGLYPSIVTNKALLNVSSAKATSIHTRITDINGRLIGTNKHSIPAGSSAVLVNCGDLAAGIYHLTTITESTATKTIRFIKQ